MIHVAARDYDKAKRVPPAFVAEQAFAASKAFEAWRGVRPPAAQVLAELRASIAAGQ